MKTRTFGGSWKEFSLKWHHSTASLQWCKRLWWCLYKSRTPMGADTGWQLLSLTHVGKDQAAGKSPCFYWTRCVRGKGSGGEAQLTDMFLQRRHPTGRLRTALWCDKWWQTWESWGRNHPRLHRGSQASLTTWNTDNKTKQSKTLIPSPSDV